MYFATHALSGINPANDQLRMDFSKPKANFGTAPVFFTAISTILGAIMFLRFGWAVGNLGFWSTVGIIVLGHLVTIPTGLAIAEIATNQKVKGGGEYFIISRSFGLNIGAAIGIALFFSQAISVAFYIIAFAEAFEPLIFYVRDTFGIDLSDRRIYSVPAMIGLTWLILKKGANLGMKALYVVVAVLFLSLILFFFGQTDYSEQATGNLLNNKVFDNETFFTVFAICFPAFTGMTAGVGLSGDLKNPRKSIPVGTLAATLCGMIIYVLIAFKFAMSASPEDLDANQLIMSDIAVWGPIIPIGLACATISSAMGSILVAPRTLQALANDRMFPNAKLNYWLSRGKGNTNEPFNATMITVVIAFIFIIPGNVDFVAEIITMFFMVTYGSLCLISFLQHFAADPSYRPSFRSRWFLSATGAFFCLILMFRINTIYAIVALIIMTLMYLVLSYYKPEHKGMAAIFRGAIFQLSRQLQVFLQKAQKGETEESWRPSIVCISADSMKRFAVFDLLRWLSYRYGFGTYIHYIEGYYSKATKSEAQHVLDKLIRLADESRSNIYLDTLISPSFTSAIAQIIQLPGISGKENNMILFEFQQQKPESLEAIMENYHLVTTAEFDFCILRSTDKGFGFHREIHIWLTPADYDNANLMILIAYIILGHPTWSKGEIKIYAVFPENELNEQQEKLSGLIQSGRLPISPANIEFIQQKIDVDIRSIVNKNSVDADLTLIGLNTFQLKNKGTACLEGFDQIGNILFVNTNKEKEIS